MEDKLEPHGDGLIEPELLLEEILVITLPVTLTLWKNVLITLLLPYLTALMSNKLLLLVTKNAQETVLLIKMTKKKPAHHMDSLQLMISNKT